MVVKLWPVGQAYLGTLGSQRQVFEVKVTSERDSLCETVSYGLKLNSGLTLLSALLSALWVQQCRQQRVGKVARVRGRLLAVGVQ